MNVEIPTSHVLSVDVFDTCITRTFAYPRDLFYALGLRLAPTTLGAIERHRFASRFQQRRIRAEKLAYRQAGRHPNLAEIYARFRALRGLTLGPGALVRAEITLERESLYPIPAMVAHIRQLRAAGHRIIFVSDTHLPRDVLGPMLRQFGVMQPQDTLYASCDVGCSKHNGTLFEHVLRTEDLQPSQLIHHGDNVLDDVRMPRQCGIEAHHVIDGALTSREQKIAGTHRRLQLPRPPAASFLAGFARRLRLTMANEPNQSPHPLDPILQTIIVPFLLAHVLWVLDDACQRGIRRLYFVARDGEVLLHIAEALQDRQRDIDLRYLYGSRRAWVPASISSNDDDWMWSIAVTGEECTPKSLTSRLGLSGADRVAMQNLAAENGYSWGTRLTTAGACQFLAHMLQHADIRNRIDATASTSREDAIRYFRQEGLLTAENWALVDAGWSLNCQAALRRILRAGSATTSVAGYYIGLAKDHLSTTQAGLARPFVEGAGSIFARRRAVVEHSFLASTHASTRGYTCIDGKVVPQLCVEFRPNGELDYARRLHATAVAAARLVAADSRVADAIATYRPAIVRNAAQLLRTPLREDALAIAQLTATPDIHHERNAVRPLCQALRVHDVCNILREELVPGSIARKTLPVWPEGSLAISPAYLRLPFNVLYAFGNFRS